MKCCVLFRALWKNCVGNEQAVPISDAGLERGRKAKDIMGSIRRTVRSTFVTNS